MTWLESLDIVFDELCRHLDKYAPHRKGLDRHVALEKAMRIAATGLQQVDLAAVEPDEFRETFRTRLAASAATGLVH